MFLVGVGNQTDYRPFSLYLKEKNMRTINIIFILSLICCNYIICQEEEDNEVSEQIVMGDSLRKIFLIDSILLNSGIPKFDDRSRDGRGARICFYNVENLFDIEDDTTINDDEFLPNGVKGWHYGRYQQKLTNIYKTMSALGGWGGPPEIIGFCEIENRKVLKDLISRTPLNKYNYDIVHENSQDARGIDVGLIYNKKSFQYISHEKLKVVFPFDTSSKTRDILYVQGSVLGKDTIHIFVNHWPSRRGGQAASEPRRLIAAQVVRDKVNEIYKKQTDANIIIMGDFNDESEDKSMVEILKAKHKKEELENKDLYNYMHDISKNWKIGSHKYQGHWGTLDQIIISPNLLSKQKSERLHSSEDGAQIFAPRFLLEIDKRYMGLQPFRTYSGPRYINGFSDHLPVYLDLIYKD